MLPGDEDDATFAQRIRQLPYEKRWEPLKSKLETLFHDKDANEISKILKDRWGFWARPEQCKRRFKSWGWKKNIPQQIQRDLSKKALKRAAQGKKTIAFYHGHPVNPQRLQRTMAEGSNNQRPPTSIFALPADRLDIIGGYVPFGNNLLINWGMKPRSGATTTSTIWTHCSPASSVETPPHVHVHTPQSVAGTSPAAVESSQTQNHLALLVSQQRSNMLSEGRLHDLLRTLNPTEQITLSMWFDQLRYSSFVTAQEWGRGPKKWTWDLLNFDHYSLPGVHSPIPVLENHQASKNIPEKSQVSEPSQSCRWTIHVHNNLIFEAEDTDDELSENEWHTKDTSQSLSGRLCEAIQANDFSNISESQLPIPIPTVASKILQNPQDLALESIAFAIMGRNYGLLSGILCDRRNREIDVVSIYPFHLAAAFLDGGKSCCLVFDALCRSTQSRTIPKSQFVNEYGHSVLDAFLLTILRSHSEVGMKTLDNSLDDDITIPGQEVDICGRWSVDSPCYRELVASGKSKVPTAWKHKFCHTAIQAIVHSSTLLLQKYPTVSQIDSGLFKHSCSNCGQVLRLGPLHALVMTALHLAGDGRPDEDLFGIIACYLALVSNGIEPFSQYEISIPQLLGLEIVSDDHCSHKRMTASDMATCIAKEQRWRFSQAAQVGWDVLTSVTRATESAVDRDDGMDQEIPEDTNDSYHEDHMDLSSECSGSESDLRLSLNTFGQEIEANNEYNDFMVYCQEGGEQISWHCKSSTFGKSNQLGHLWAAIQAELVNHRKVTDNDQWLSASFSMINLRKSMAAGNRPNVEYIDQSLLKPYCQCGIFEDQDVSGLVHQQSVFFQHSGNLDGTAETWNRSSFIGTPDLERWI